MAAGSATWSRWRVRLGYPLAVAYLWLANPSPQALSLGAGIGLLGLLIRGAAAGHLRKHESLATSGPYAFTRNPLYFGSAFLAAGLIVAGRSLPAAALVGLYFAAFYSAVMKREEGELRARYGSAFEAYAARVPLFWPRWTPGQPVGESFSWVLYFQNREYQAALGFLLGLLLLWGKMRWPV